MSVIGGSGVRMPLSPEDRTEYDRKTLTRLQSYGMLTRTNTHYPPESPLRSAAIPLADSHYLTLYRTQIFNPDRFYQAAASQLDILLPALAQPTLPAVNTLRTITLRIQPVVPDAAAVRELKLKGLIEGRAVITRSIASWKVQCRNAEEALMEAIDGIIGRLALEGYVTLEEWWDVKRGLCLLTVRS